MKINSIKWQYILLMAVLISLCHSCTVVIKYPTTTIVKTDTVFIEKECYPIYKFIPNIGWGYNADTCWGGHSKIDSSKLLTLDDISDLQKGDSDLVKIKKLAR